MSIRIAFVGAGSYVFGPSFLSQLLLENKLGAFHLSLMDPDQGAVLRMAAIARQMARQFSAPVTMSTHVNLADSLAGADFVVCCAAVQMRTRFAMDRRILSEVYPEHLVSEFGGVAGISYSLRQIAFVKELAMEMHKACPHATLLTVSNPLPRVVQAAEALGVRTIGFCSAALAIYRSLSRLFGMEAESYPFAESRRRWRVLAAGVNHLACTLSLADADGLDISGAAYDAIQAGATSGNPRSDAVFLERGSFWAAEDPHTQDFLPPDFYARSLEAAWHGDDDERSRQIGLQEAYANGAVPVESILAFPSWERPGDVIHSLVTGRQRTFEALNLPNTGQVPALPLGAIVETPASVDREGILAAAVRLPSAMVPDILLASQVTSTIVRAGLERRLALVDEALDLDPTVLDKEKGRIAMHRCLNAHQDLLPSFY